MTYFFLICIAFLSTIVFLSAIRVGVLEERITMLERDHHALAHKGNRVGKKQLWQMPPDYEDVDYD